LEEIKGVDSFFYRSIIKFILIFFGLYLRWMKVEMSLEGLVCNRSITEVNKI
jgi:hypothetical protein